MNFVRRTLCGALMLAAVPAVAEAATPVGGVAVSDTATLAPGVEAFYQARGNRPLWLQQGRTAAADALLAVLRSAPLDGLRDGPALAAGAEMALARGQLIEADRLLSSAWVRYVQALGTPAAGMIYGDPALAPRGAAAGAILVQAAASGSITDHVARVSKVNPFYSQLRAAALAETRHDGVASPDRRLLANLERARAIPGSGRFVMVDAAAQRLYMVEDGEVRDTMKVVVGKPENATPMIASTIHYATFNPYWNVPADLVRERIAPSVLQHGAAYLTDKRYEVLSGFEDDARVISPAEVDWKAVAEGRATARVRQLPGNGNFMGDMKFGFANSGGVFLHDTPDKHLFAESVRTFSSGCVRLEDAPRLARWMLGGDPRVAPGVAEQHVKLPRPVPVFITYLTAQARDGRLTYVADVYGRDRETRMASSR